MLVEFKAAYYVHTNTQGFGPIAVVPVFHSLSNGRHRCDWNNTGERGSSFYFQPPTPSLNPDKSPPREFSLCGEEGVDEIRFSYLTQNVFNEHVKGKVFGSGKLEGLSDEKLQDHYLKNYYFTLS